MPNNYLGNELISEMTLLRNIDWFSRRNTLIFSKYLSFNIF